MVNYVKPEMLIISVVLYFIGIWMKQSETIKDKYIPVLLGIIGIVVCGIYVFATCSCDNSKETAMAIFTAITQGVLVAGLSNYVNQILKQLSKKE